MGYLWELLESTFHNPQNLQIWWHFFGTGVLRGIYCGLHMRCPPETHGAEGLTSEWCCYFGKLWKLQMLEPLWKNESLGCVFCGFPGLSLPLSLYQFLSSSLYSLFLDTILKIPFLLLDSSCHCILPKWLWTKTPKTVSHNIWFFLWYCSDRYFVARMKVWLTAQCIYFPRLLQKTTQNWVA